MGDQGEDRGFIFHHKDRLASTAER
jgi:hypothetical protein